MVEDCDQIGNNHVAIIADAFETLFEFVMMRQIDADHAAILLREILLQCRTRFRLPENQKIFRDFKIAQCDLGIERCTQRFPRRLASSGGDGRMFPRPGQCAKKNADFLAIRSAITRACNDRTKKIANPFD